MDHNEAKMRIDEEKFACAVVSSHRVESDSMEELAKKQLVLYLTAYYLADKFNNLEENFFQNLDNMDDNDYEKFMLRISGLRAFR